MVENNDKNDVENFVLQASKEELEWLRANLRSHGNVPWEDPSGGVLTKLFEAVEDGADEETEQLLTELGAHSIDTIGPEGDTLLHLACLYAHTRCAKLLLDHGASLQVKDEDDSTVLHDAAAGGELEIVRLLVDRDASLVHAVDSDGDTPLHNAARGGNMDVVQFLLLEGANPHTKNQQMQTARDACDDVEELREILLIAEKAFKHDK